MRSGWRWWLVAVAVAAVAHPWLPDAPGDLLLTAVGATSVALILRTTLRRRPTPLAPWLLLAAGQAAFVTGDALWGWYDAVLHQDPFPSAADAAYLLGYPLLALGLWHLQRARDPGRDRGTLIDALIVTVGAGMVTWVFLIVPLADDPSLGLAGRLIAGAYPAADLLLLSLLVRSLLGAGRRSPAFRMLGAAYAVLLVADVAFAVGELTGVALLDLADVGFLLTYGLAAGAALHPSQDAVTRSAPAPSVSLTRGRLAALALACLLTPAVIAYQTLSDARVDGLLIAGSSGALVMLVMLRMSGLVRQVERQASDMAALARVDGLTGVGNRRAWDEALPVALADAARRGLPLSVGILDLDRFKAFNDRLGHPAGDDLLRRTAQAWRMQLRTSDVLARYGGEEFAVLLPGCAEAEAHAVLDQLRRAVPLDQTCSAGVAVWDGGESPTALVGRADEALYRAKVTDRDRTVASSSLPSAAVVAA